MMKSIFSIHSKYLSVAKVIAYRNVSRARYKQSFQYRILDYFENELKTQKASQQYEISTQIKENLHETNIVKQRYQCVSKNIEQLLNLTDQEISKQFVNDLDMQCSSLENSLKHSEVLSLLNALLKLIPNRLITTNFYNNSMIVLLKAVESGLLSNHEIIQLLFFLSFKKENSSSYINYLTPYIPDMNELPLIEQCIAAQAFYKSSVKLKPCQSRVLEKVLEEKCECLISDPLLLVSLCKVIRISGLSNDLKLKNLSRAILNMKTPFNFTTTVHVLSLYAEALLLDKAVDQLVRDSIEVMRQDTIKCSLRLKDVDRFLWSISHLGLTLTLNKKIVLQIYFEERLQEYKTKPNLGILVNSILCLHILQCYNTKIINSLLEEGIFEPVFYEKFHWKIKSRVQLLINQITLEMKITVPQSLKKQIKISYTPSEYVNSVAEVGSTLVNRGIIKDVIVECPIYTLQIPGVTLITEKNRYHIDILDNSTCLRNTNIPHGLMNLKLRLLSRLKYQQILISNRVFNDAGRAHLLIEQHIINSITQDKTLTSLEKNTSSL